MSRPTPRRMTSSSGKPHPPPRTMQTIKRPNEAITSRLFSTHTHRSGVADKPHTSSIGYTALSRRGASIVVTITGETRDCENFIRSANSLGTFCSLDRRSDTPWMGRRVYRYLRSKTPWHHNSTGEARTRRIGRWGEYTESMALYPSSYLRRAL